MATCRYFTTIDGQPVEITPMQPDIRLRMTWSGAKFGTDAIKSESGRVVIKEKSVGEHWMHEFTYRHLGRHTNGKVYEADRVIFRKSNPSNHKCDARCLSAKGHNCECSCGGKFHGAGALAA